MPPVVRPSFSRAFNNFSRLHPGSVMILLFPEAIKQTVELATQPCSSFFAYPSIKILMLAIIGDRISPFHLEARGIEGVSEILKMNDQNPFGEARLILTHTYLQTLA